VKCIKQQEFVIAGYTPSEKGVPGIGSLILGVYEKGELIYSGRVGTGFTLKKRVELQKQLDKIARDKSPFTVKPKATGLGEAHWVSPLLVAEVAFTEWTVDGAIRHPSFQGLREDKKPEDVRREQPGV
jgi:bifunctional non-homologous end joining protein LigD